MAGAGTTPRFAWGATFTTANNAIQFNEGGASAVASIAAGTYYWLQDGSADDLCLALETALDAASLASLGGRTYTATISSAGILEIQSSAAAVWEVEWSHANTAVPDTLFGALDVDESSDGSGSLTSDHQVGNVWNPEAPYPQESENRPRYRSTSNTTGSARSRTERWGGRTRRRILCDHLASNKIFTAEETVANEAFQRFFEDCISLGLPFYFTPDITAPAATAAYVWDPDRPEGKQEMSITIPSQLIRLYDVEILMQAYVA